MAESSASCPICMRPAAPAYRPFCGRRCADLDLGRWLTGQYVVPGLPDPFDEAAVSIISPASPLDDSAADPTQAVR
jgi:endogenous inhibitor of DNA gyrase (YacG/DUF329 family)